MVQSSPTEGTAQAPYLRAAHVQPGGRLIDLPDQQMWFTNAELRTLTLRRDDVVIVEGGAGYGRSAVLREDLDGWGFQNSIIRVRPLRTRSEGRFLDYAIQAALRWGEIDSLVSTATIPHFTAEKVGRLPIVWLPVKQQGAIADYLDRETAQIDAFIAKNEELIALLAERRTAVITHAVTRGIDASAQLKASGVAWLGEVPERWAVQRLASTVERAQNGIWGSDPEGGEEDLRCVRVADFDRQKQRIHDDSHTLRKLTASERAGRVLRNGDLLLEKSGGGEKSPVGFVVLYDRDEPAVCSNFVARVQLRNEMDPRFWTYVHGAMYRQRITERSIKQSTGIQNLDQSAYFNEYVAVPPYSEQSQIADYLERRTEEIDGAVDTARLGVQLARERRAALISAAVTGKIDVGVVA
ncbi:hypothetical protein [Microbacterium sp.]|uniref:hypothetical protein n=1 Tax=Microbacterium sp. TaxID=51671 RepID=UPI00391A6873